MLDRVTGGLRAEQAAALALRMLVFLLQDQLIEKLTLGSGSNTCSKELTKHNSLAQNSVSQDGLDPEWGERTNHVTDCSKSMPEEMETTETL